LNLAQIDLTLTRRGLHLRSLWRRLLVIDTQVPFASIPAPAQTTPFGLRSGRQMQEGWRRQAACESDKDDQGEDPDQLCDR
jgi:hypothetical protein